MTCLSSNSRPSGHRAALVGGLLITSGTTCAIGALFATVLARLGTDPRRIPALASAAVGRPVRTSVSLGNLVAWLDRDPGTALAALATTIGWLVLGWLVIGVVVHTLAVVPGAGAGTRRLILGALSSRMLPRFIRQSLEVGVRAAVVVGIAGGTTTAVAAAPVLVVAHPATATPGPSLGWPDLDRPTGPAPTFITKDAGNPAPTLSSPSGNPAVPTTPPVVLATSAPQEAPTSNVADPPSTGTPHPDDSRVLVAPGDSLWRIAAVELGTSGSAERIAARWPQWYAANQALIGPDPNLILPGQWLARPPSPSAAGGLS